MQNNIFAKRVYRRSRLHSILSLHAWARRLVAGILFSIVCLAASSGAGEIFDRLPHLSIEVGDNPQAVAVTHDGRYAYIANFNSDNLSVVDLHKKIKTGDIPTGDGPSSIVIAGDNSFLAVTHFFSGDIWFIDPLTSRVKSGFQVGDGPSAAVLSPGDDMLYVANRIGRTVAVIDTGALQLSSIIQLDNYPQGLAISPDGKRLFISFGDDGSVAAIDPITGKVVGRIPTGGSPRALAVSPDGEFLYTGDYDTGKLLVINVQGLKAANEVEVGGGATDIAVHPNGSEAFVLNRKRNTLTRIDLTTGRGAEYAVGPLPGRSAIIPETGDVLVTLSGLNELHIIAMEAISPADKQTELTTAQSDKKALKRHQLPRDLKEPVTVEPKSQSPMGEIPTTQEESSRPLKEPVSQIPVVSGLKTEAAAGTVSPSFKGGNPETAKIASPGRWR